MDDIQSWWEVPSIAHFCSLFRAAFNLLDFDIEELEEALLTDGAEDSGSSLLQELIVRLLCGCLGNNDISTFNYQMFLRRLFRQKCQEYGRDNPFNTDIDFQFLPLRTKVEILHALCDFRLDADDVQDLLKNLESDSLRVVPLGYDENKSAYWYFYGTRLYREDFPKRKKKAKEKRKKGHEDKRHKKHSKSQSESDCEEEQGIWQVICFTESDWDKVTHSFKDSTSKCEKALFHTLVEDFLPEIPRLFAEKERLQRKRMLEYRPRRQSTRLEKLKQQKEEEERIQLKEHQLRIQFEEEVEPKERFRQSEEDLQTGLYKILEHIKSHEDAWPFTDPVDEAYAPRYYSIISKPMDLKCMEDKLDEGRYNSFSEFKADFQLIVDNCRQYNGTDNEYTEMVGNLLEAFRHASDRYLESDPSSDEEIAVEFPRSPPEKQLQPVRHRARRKKKKKKRKAATEDSPRDSPPSLSPSSVHSSASEKNTRQMTARSKAETESEKEEVESASKGPPSSTNSNKYRSNVSKNSVEAIEALELATEQTLKDINKWLDDTPRFAEFSSASNSPSHFIRAEEYEIVASSIEQDYRRSLKLDRAHRKDGPKRRPNKDPLKLQRRREIQRTIDRLQPGKSKGNLLSNIQSVNKTADDGNSSTLGKSKDKTNSLINNTDEKAPKLSLGTVLTSDVLSFGVGGQSHNFDEELKYERKSLTSDMNSSIFQEIPKSISPEPQTFSVTHTKKEKDEDEKPLNKEIKQEKPTPNLSAWFKAFGAPKTVVNQKKKPDTIIKPEESIKMKKLENRVTSPNPSSVDTHSDIERMWSDRRNVSQGLIAESDHKFVHSPPHSRITDEPSSPVGPPVLHGISRQRRVSTGSSVSERSSFSQDTDGCSPRLTLDERLGSYPGPYPSPLHRSPMTASPVMASPRSEDIPKPTPYPPINGTIRVGFYQDTSSSFQKNSPEKSNMSPRDRVTPSSLPNYSPRLYSTPHDPGGFVPYRGQVPQAYDNLPPYGIPSLMQYYDTKSVIDQYKVIRTQASDDYPSSTVSATTMSDTSSHTSVTSKTPATMFPVKKRLYSEMESGIGPTRVHSSLNETNRVSSPHSSPCSSPHHSPPQNLQDQENRLYPPRSPENSPICRTTSPNSSPSPHVTDRLHLPHSSPQLYPSNLSTSNRSSLIRQTTVDSHLLEKVDVDLLSQGKLNEVCSSATSLPVSQVLSRTQQSTFDKSGTNVNNSDSKIHSDSTTVSNLNSPRNSPLSMVKRLSPPNSVISHPHTILQHKSLHSVSSTAEGACNSPENQTSLSLKEDHRSVRVPEIGYHRPPYSPVPPNSLSIDTTLALRGNISHMVDRYNSEERIMPGLQVPTAPFYGNKSLFSQTPSTALQVPVSSVPMFEKTSPSVTSTVHEMPVLSGRMAEMQAVYTRAVPDLPSILATKTPVTNTSSPYTSAVSDLSVLTNKVSSPLNIPPSYMRTVASDLSIPRKEITNSDGPRIYNHPNADLPPSVLSSKVSSSMNMPPNYSRSNQEMSNVAYNKGPPGQESALMSSKQARKKKTKQPTTTPETPVMTPSTAFQHYVGNKSLTESSPMSLKATSIVPGSAFNFGPGPTTLGLYADKESYPTFLDEYRTSTPSFYVGSDPAREKSNAATSSFPFLSHPQARPPSYPYINQSPLMEPSYQQYLQRHQEELLRHTGTPMVLHQGLLAPPAGFAPGYHPALSIRQPYDALNRPSWL